ncbi:transcriptional regulator NrdR [Tepidimonas charontis]|uniref:Transcriptional repressor NrdR n=1 Tax=Tepidimonas charontis TaxID=2267262 RepID=A0A554X9J5_9BURK|nr:transcriptional regulator NrdR [Tepidimonas charontis]TSE32456.1 Transcriptional repressor NrdR [Tepidimonas charontis]
MKCPFCGHADTQVVETRESDDGMFVRRRRRCGGCDRRFTTYERVELTFPQVVKKDGRRVDYDPAKLRASFALALRKRPVGAADIDAAMARIEEKLLAEGAREVSAQRIGEWVMEELRQLDQVAYVRFASVYRSFEDVDAFRSVIDEVRR